MTQGSKGSAPRRVGIVVTELGIPSEVWILRQCREFQAIKPVFFYWRRHPEFDPEQEGVEAHQFAANDSRAVITLRRWAARLGLADALLPTRRTRAGMRDALLNCELEGLLCHFAWTGMPVSAAMGGKLPIVWQVHGRDVSSQLLQPAYRRAMRKALPSLAHLVAVGRFQIETLKPLGLSPRHSVIPCGAPTTLFAQREMPTRAPDEPLQFIGVGRLSKEKGVIQSFRAFEQVASAEPNVRLAFIGSGPAEAELKALVAASPVGSKVEFHGLQPPDRVADILSRSHVFVQHSRPEGGWVEGFGVSITEAGAAGLPLVVSRLGGIVDQVEEGENGLLFDPDDVDGQAQVMLKLVRDEALRRRMGGKAREIAQRFDSKLMTAQLERVILDAIDARTPQPTPSSAPARLP